MSDLEQLRGEAWFKILEEETKRTSISDVARKLDYSRPTISLVLSGRYNGGTGAIAAKVTAVFTDRVHCPHLGADLVLGVCSDHQSRPMPTSDPSALRHWIACRTGCPHSNHTIEDDKNHA